MTSLLSEICILASLCLFLLSDNVALADDVDYETMLLDLLVDKYGNDADVFSGRSYGMLEELECADKNTRCKSWKRHCKSWKYKDFLKNFCPKRLEASTSLTKRLTSNTAEFCACVSCFQRSI